MDGPNLDQCSPSLRNQNFRPSSRINFISSWLLQTGVEKGLLSAAVKKRLQPANASLTTFPGGPSCSHAAPLSANETFGLVVPSGSLSNSTTSFAHHQTSLLQTPSCSSGGWLVIFGHSAQNPRRRLVFLDPKTGPRPTRER